MNARVFCCTLWSAVFPFSGMVLILMMKESLAAAGLIWLACTLIQIPTLILCRKALVPFVDPDLSVLQKIGVAFVPAPYEPGRFRKDKNVAAFAMWLGLLGPFLCFLAIQHPEEIAILEFASYTTPSLNFLIPGFLLVLLGMLALPFWFEAARAAAMYNAGSEKKRYLLRGFVDKLDQPGAVDQFLSALKKN